MAKHLPDQLLQDERNVIRKKLGGGLAHGFHHRHYMGKIEAVAFVSFELTSKLFASEWIQIASSLNAKGTSS